MKEGINIRKKKKHNFIQIIEETALLKSDQGMFIFNDFDILSKISLSDKSKIR